MVSRTRGPNTARGTPRRLTVGVSRDSRPSCTHGSVSTGGTPFGQPEEEAAAAGAVVEQAAWELLLLLWLAYCRGGGSSGGAWRAAMERGVCVKARGIGDWREGHDNGDTHAMLSHHAPVAADAGPMACHAPPAAATAAAAVAVAAAAWAAGSRKAGAGAGAGAAPVGSGERPLIRDVGW